MPYLTSAEVAALPTPRQAREAAGFGGTEGLERLAKIIGVAPRTIRDRYEHGLMPNPLYLPRLCKTLHCTYHVWFYTSRKTAEELAAASATVDDSGRPALRRRTVTRRRGKNRGQGTSAATARSLSPQFSSDEARSGAAPSTAPQTRKTKPAPRDRDAEPVGGC